MPTAEIAMPYSPASLKVSQVAATIVTSALVIGAAGRVLTPEQNGTLAVAVLAAAALTTPLALHLPETRAIGIAWPSASSSSLSRCLAGMSSAHGSPSPRSSGAVRTVN